MCITIARAEHSQPVQNVPEGDGFPVEQVMFFIRRARKSYHLSPAPLIRPSWVIMLIGWTAKQMVNWDLMNPVNCAICRRP